MALDTSIYRNLGSLHQVAPLDVAGSMEKGANLRSLALKNDTQERDAKYQAHLQKASAFGNALEGMAGMSPQERAAAYPKVRGELIGSGIIGEQDAPPELDEGFYRQSLMKFRDSKEYLDKSKTKAEIAKLSAEASHRGTDDPMARQMAMIDYRNAAERRMKDDEMRRYANIGGWKLSEGATPTADDSKKFKAGVSSARSLLDNLNKYQNLVKKHGSEFTGKTAQQMDSLVRDIQLSAKNEDLYGLGVLTGPDLQLLEELIQAPTGLGAQFNPMAGSRAVNKAQEFRDLLNARISGKAKTYGFEPDEEWRTLARGGNQPAPQGGTGMGANEAFAGTAPPAGVRMQGPDGKVRIVPQDQVGEAIAAGGKRLK